MPDVVLATCDAMPALDADERLLLTALRRRGLDVECWSWTRPDTDWSRAGLCVIRTTWDYASQLPAFLDWTERVGARLRNPPELVAWNANKRYLCALESAGVPVVPTRWLSRGERADLASILRSAGWSAFVLKPAVGATAMGALRGGPADLARAQAHLDTLLADGDVLVQPFLDGVVAHGELSAVFVEGWLSHGLVKRPRAGDWRVQEEWGGRATPHALSPEAIRIAERALAAAPEPGLYARVDLVPLPEGGLGVIELELIEPALYLGCGEGAADRLAEAISRGL